jgi:hypothetical protein
MLLFSFMAYRSPLEIRVGLVTNPDTPPFSNRHHPVSCIAHGKQPPNIRSQISAAACPKNSDDGQDNVFIERLWRSLKHEDIYPKGYADGRDVKDGISSWMEIYNGRAFIKRLAIAPQCQSGLKDRRPRRPWT